MIYAATQAQPEFSGVKGSGCCSSGSNYDANGNANVNMGAPMVVLPGPNANAVVQPATVVQPAAVVNPTTAQASAAPSNTSTVDSSAGQGGEVEFEPVPNTRVAESQLTTSNDASQAI